MACDGVPWFYLFKGWFSTPAYVHHLQASCLETAAGRGANGLCDLAFDFRNGPLIGRVGNRNRSDKGLGIGVKGFRDHFFGDAQFHYPTQIHDH